jgi:putative transposase
MAMKRHSPAEVAEKMRRAMELETQGRSHREIIRALGVSAMTYHRWRKARPAGEARRAPDVGHAAADMDALRSENDQLRRALTDLLLQKMHLEEQLRSRLRGRS